MKRLAIVGMAKTSRHLAPWDDEDVEIWGLNEAYWGGHKGPDGLPFMKRWDRWFQMHPRWDCMREDNFNHQKHAKWLRNDPWEIDELAEIELFDGPVHPEMNGATKEQRRRTDFPIYMLEEFEDVPGCVVYPFDDVISCIPTAEENLRYFTQTLSYMLGLALLEGFDEIGIYGFEMASQTEYSYQKPCAEFWLGVELGTGVKLVLPPGCNLLGGTEILYGYEKTPGLTRMHLEISRNSYGKELEKVRKKIGEIEGRMSHINHLLKGSLTKGKREKLEQEFANLQAAHMQALIPFNVFSMAVKMRQNDILTLDGQPTRDDIKFIVPGGKGEDE